MTHPTEDIRHFLRPGVRVHMAGIGGVSMSPLAEVLKDAGLIISGSDIAESERTSHLREKGINIYIGHDAENIAPGTEFIVRTAAAHDDEVTFLIVGHIQKDRSRRTDFIDHLRLYRFRNQSLGFLQIRLALRFQIFCQLGREAAFCDGDLIKIAHRGYHVTHRSNEELRAFTVFSNSNGLLERFLGMFGAIIRYQDFFIRKHMHPAFL